MLKSEKIVFSLLKYFSLGAKTLLYNKKIIRVGMR